MDARPKSRGTRSASELKSQFRALRRHNEYGARVGRALEAKRIQRIARVITLQRKHRSRQAR